MAQLLRYSLSVAILVLVSTQSVCSDEPAPKPDALPAGAVARFGTSRFLNFGRMFSLAFSPDGKILAGGAWDGSVRLWEVASGKELHLFQEMKSPILTLAFSPDGSMFAFDGKNSEIVLRETATGKEIRRLKGHKGAVTCVAFSPDGTMLASNAHDRTLRLWDLADGREIRRLGSQATPKLLSDASCPIAFVGDGKTVISATFDSGPNNMANSATRTFRVWNTATGAEVRSFPDDSLWHGPIAFSPSKGLLAAAAGVVRGQPPRISLWDVENGKALPPVDMSQSNRFILLSSMIFSPDGKMLASSEGGLIQLWEVSTRREAMQIAIPENGAIGMAFSPSGRLLALGSTDTSALLWDITGRMKNGTLPATKLSQQECQALWNDLGSTNTSKARQALWAMVAGDGESVTFLQTHLHPVASPTSNEAIAQLVADLNSPEYKARAKASAQLIQLAEIAEPALVQAQKNNPSLEMRRRVDQLLKAIVDLRIKPTEERVRSWRGVEILEQINTPQARDLLRSLSKGAAGAMLTREAQASLARMERQMAH